MYWCHNHVRPTGARQFLKWKYEFWGARLLWFVFAIMMFEFHWLCTRWSTICSDFGCRYEGIKILQTMNGLNLSSDKGLAHTTLPRLHNNFHYKIVPIVDAYGWLRAAKHATTVVLLLSGFFNQPSLTFIEWHIKFVSCRKIRCIPVVWWRIINSKRKHQ